MAKWRSYMQITGAPLTDDGAPNDAVDDDPGAARTFVADSNTVMVQLLDGTSATATVWAKDPDGGTDPWEQIDTGAIGTTVPLVLDVTKDRETFVQLTSVTGSPTNCLVLDGAAFPAVVQALVSRAALNIDSATLHADVDQVEAKLDTLHTDTAAVETAVDLTTTAVDLTTTAVDAVATAVAQYPNESEDVDISSDDHTFTISCRWLYVGTFGDVIYRLAGDSGDHTLVSVPGGTLLPGKFSKIIKTGTTATSMVGFEDG